MGHGRIDRHAQLEGLENEIENAEVEARLAALRAETT